MNSTSIKLQGTRFVVWYNGERIKDPLMTGDSPTQLEIELESIEFCGVDFMPLLDAYWIEVARKAAIEDFRGC